MREYPDFTEDYHKKEVEDLKAEDWQLELLKKNPSYVYWGCFEDYMSEKDSGWRARVMINKWPEFIKDWSLNEYNEVVNFYFEVTRKSENCEHCEQTGLNPATRKIQEDWYSFDSPDYVYVSETKRINNNAWHNHLTKIEVEALIKAGRLSDLAKKTYIKPLRKILIEKNGNEEFEPTKKYWFEEKENKWIGWVGKRSNQKRVEVEQPEYPTPEEVNEWNKTGIGHDAINRSICVQARAEHLGTYGLCEHCHGEGSVYIEQKAKVALQLWVIHPRKGCSRGVYIEDIKQKELPSVIDFLKKAQERNTERFSKL